MSDFYLGVDVGGTSIKYALLDGQANLSRRNEKPTPDTLDGYLDLMEAIASEYPEACALVMAAPGKIDADTGYFHTGGALNYIHELDLASMLQQRIHMPVSVENDAKAAAEAELWKGTMQGVTNGIVMTLGTGIGGSLIINGHLYRGSTGAAGEFSMIPTLWKHPYGGMWCETGCTSALTDRLANARGLDPAAMNGRLFFDCHNKGDEKAVEALDAFCADLAVGLYGLQLVADVEKIAIGGGISRQPALIECLNEKMKELYEGLPAFNPASLPEVTACTFTSDANLIGALYHHLERISYDHI